MLSGRSPAVAGSSTASLILLIAIALAIAFLAVWGRAYTPGTGLDGTPHDWSTGSGTTVLLWRDQNGSATTYNTGTPWIDPATGKQGTTTVANGKCVTCHVPDTANASTLKWNYTLPSTGYRWTDLQTTAGTTYPTFQQDTYKGPSVKCLSCHDGMLVSGLAMSRGGDLSQNHPFAMPYPINGIQNRYNFVRNGAYIEGTEWVPNPMATNGIRLYHDDEAGNIGVGVVAGRTGIECTSCHDPHNSPRVKDHELVTGLLGGSDRGAGGYICTQCHAK